MDKQSSIALVQQRLATTLRASGRPRSRTVAGPHGRSGTAVQLNWLCAVVLEANDGAMSTVGLIGVAGATSARGLFLTAGSRASWRERSRWSSGGRSR